MRITFECSCGTTVEVMSDDGREITEWATCPDCESKFSVTITQTYRPEDQRFI
jgi:transposase